MNDTLKNEKVDKAVWPPPPDQERVSVPEPPRRERKDTVWRILIPVYLIMGTGLIAGYASYHFHLVHIIRAAHAGRLVEMSVNITTDIMIALVIVRVIWQVWWQVKHSKG